VRGGGKGVQEVKGVKEGWRVEGGGEGGGRTRGSYRVCEGTPYAHVVILYAAHIDIVFTLPKFKRTCNTQQDTNRDKDRLEAGKLWNSVTSM
jgi:hypothetical protein